MVEEEKMFSIIKKLSLILKGKISFIPVSIKNYLVGFFIQFGSKIVSVQGNKMYVDKYDSMRLSFHGIHEPLETKIFRNLLKRGDAVVDIGANIGYYTLIAAKKISKDGKVFAFEPEPYNFSILEKNIKLNRFNNIKAIKMAVSETKGKSNLFLSEEIGNTGSHTLQGKSNKTTLVAVISLDEFFKHSDKIDIIKMDAEGAEYSIFKGMLNIIKRNHKIKIIMEFIPSNLKNFGIEPKHLLFLIERYKFIIYNIDEEHQRLKRTTPLYLIHKCKNKNFSTNLVCSRENLDEKQLIR